MRFQDYIVGGVVILGVLAVWFFIIAALMGLVGAQLGLTLAGVSGLIVYVAIKRRKAKR